MKKSLLFFSALALFGCDNKTQTRTTVWVTGNDVQFNTNHHNEGDTYTVVIGSDTAVSAVFKNDKWVVVRQWGKRNALAEQ